MTTYRFAATLLLALAAASAGLAHAQATRTWVSGVGDDANPCSRTAPCKTFAGAISKTAVGGEIDVLDPGGYGTLTITKSITIDGGGGSGWASVLNAGVNGIIINAAAGDSVTLRNLSFNGAGSGVNGMRIIVAGKVSIEHVQILGNTGVGISDERTFGKLSVSNTVVRNNGGTGIAIVPPSATSLDVTLDHVELFANGNSGLTVTAGAHVDVRNSCMTGNVNYGLYMDQNVGGTQVSLNDCLLAGNSVGILMGPGMPTLLLSNVSVMDNSTGMVRGTGPVYTFNNNRFIGNAAGSGPFSPGFTPVTPL
jgi:hypothetical protein